MCLSGSGSIEKIELDWAMNLRGIEARNDPPTEPLGAFIMKGNNIESVEGKTGKQMADGLTGIPILRRLSEKIFGARVNRRRSPSRESNPRR